MLAPLGLRTRPLDVATLLKAGGLSLLPAPRAKPMLALDPARPLSGFKISSISRYKPEFFLSRLGNAGGEGGIIFLAIEVITPVVIVAAMDFLVGAGAVAVRTRGRGLDRDGSSF